jgi:hypothetical protein
VREYSLFAMVLGTNSSRRMTVQTKKLLCNPSCQAMSFSVCYVRNASHLLRESIGLPSCTWSCLLGINNGVIYEGHCLPRYDTA